ncbi:unnamed protein product, partial [marine sediment metagenome]
MPKQYYPLPQTPHYPFGLKLANGEEKIVDMTGGDRRIEFVF